MNIPEEVAAAHIIEPTSGEVSSRILELGMAQRTLKYDNCDPVNHIGGEILIQGPVDRLKGSESEEVRSPIPSDIIERMEFGSYLWDSNVDNIGVERDEEGTKEKRRNHNTESP